MLPYLLRICSVTLRTFVVRDIKKKKSHQTVCSVVTQSTLSGGIIAVFIIGLDLRVVHFIQDPDLLFILIIVWD